MINTFIKKYGVHRKKSYMVGDSDRDILAGKNAGLKTILVHSPKINDYRINVKPDFRTNNLKVAVDIILKDKHI